MSLKMITNLKGGGEREVTAKSRGESKGERRELKEWKVKVRVRP